MSASVTSSMRARLGLAARPRAPRRRLQRGRVRVAHGDELDAIGVLLDGAEMVGRDAAATDQREADAPVADRRRIVAHAGLLRP